MSKETLKFLRDNVRYGFTEEIGPAWWADEDHMSDGSHFNGPVPEDEVYKLLDVRLVSGPSTSVFTGSNGERIPVNDSTRQQIIRVLTDDSGNEYGETLGVFKSGYQIHGYNEWINKLMRDVLDSDLQTSCAALLRKGAVAFHQVRLPDTYEVAGFGFVPNFTAATSCDGSMASIGFTGIDAACCDNTFDIARNNALTSFAQKHTKNSPSNIGEIRNKLGLVLKAGEDFAEMADEFLKVDVSEKDFSLWLDEIVPMPEAKTTKGGGPGRGYTMAETKRDQLTQLWTSDAKVAPWAGTKFGILQLDNTWRTWNRGVHGADGGRMERNLLNLVKGETAEADRFALDALDRVHAKTMVFA
jgi:phage/plasmid-like protein (TIGR03299 family)